MGYSERDLARIKLGVCLGCGFGAQGGRRRCVQCRTRLAEKRVAAERRAVKLCRQLQRENRRLRAQLAALIGGSSKPKPKRKKPTPRQRDRERLKSRQLSYTTLKEKTEQAR